MKKMLHKIKENRSIVDAILILIVAIVISIPMFNNNNDIYLDDGSQHLMRAYGTYQSIFRDKEATIISDFVNNFGYSWNLFYGPLSTYLIIIAGIIFGGFNLGFKIIIIATFFTSGILMYKFVNELTSKRNTGLLAGVIYITSPYFFTDIYVRHAIGEAISFTFIPMVFLGLYNLFNTEKNHYYLIFGTVGLILTHNISTILTAIFSFIYCIVNFKNLSSTRVKKGLIIDFVFILLITSFYWIPFLEAKCTTNYQVFEQDAMTSKDKFLANCIEINDLLNAKNGSNFIFEIGMPVIFMLIFSIMTLSELKENKKEYIFFLISGIVSALMATKYFPWKWLPNAFLIIQFPWRLLVFSSFFFAIICSINMTTVIRNFKITDVLIITIICVIYLYSKQNVIAYNENVPKVENYAISSVSGQNNEWLPGMGRLEYLPSKAYENTFYIATREKGILALEGNCNIEEENKIGTHLLAKITTENDDVKLELPYIYYPGYTLRFDGIIINQFETENGFLGCRLPKEENGKLEVEYTGTKLMQITKLLSIISFVVFIVYVWKKH